MAKTLYLLRHAQASSTLGKSDRERPLTDKGKQDMRFLAERIMSEKISPDYTLCSPARRTMQTLEIIKTAFSDKAADYPDGLYNATPEKLLDFIHDIDDAHHTALVVAHNPGIHALALSLAAKGDTDSLRALSYGYKPGSLSVIKCACDQWLDLRLDENRLEALFIPDEC